MTELTAVTLLLSESAHSYVFLLISVTLSRLSAGRVITKQHHTQLRSTCFGVFKISGFNALSVVASISFVFIILLFLLFPISRLISFLAKIYYSFS